MNEANLTIDWTLPPAQLPLLLALVVCGWAFATAASIGSFLNVVIARVPKGISVIKPRSRCPKCQNMITARDNIPIVSWVLLRGKCRNCSLPISKRYPLIELLVGLIGLGIVMRFGLSLMALECFVFASVLVAIAWVDIDTWTVPHGLWGTLVATGLVFGVLDAWLLQDAWVLGDRLIGGFAAFAILALVIIAATGILRRTGRLGPDETAMGWGDPLILVGIGAFLGYRLLPLVLFLASVQGAAVGIALKASGKLQWDQPVSEDDPWIPPAGALPFGPFLALAGLEAAFFGEAWLSMWRSLVGLG